MRLFYSVLFSVFWSAVGLGQPFPQDYFRNPINIPITLAGSFGELRTNHFHTGIDIKTCGDQGLPVYASADGYISRIGISASGYGNVLYIDHPNGYTTVYGHLLKFIDPIQKFVRATQYKTESFEQDILIEQDKFPVKKGELIAFSGNTGGSAGPHLHFEIRESKTERPVNPLLFGFDVKDTISPSIRAIKIYALDSGSWFKVVFAKGKSLLATYGQNIKLDAGGLDGKYFLKNVSRLEGHGNIGFAIEAKDYLNDSYNPIGVFSIEMCIGEQPQYLKNMSVLDFALKRYVNYHIDYAEQRTTGRWFEKCFVLEKNDLPIYDSLRNRGIVELSGNKQYNLSWYCKDIENNQSVLAIQINSSDSANANYSAGPISKIVWKYSNENKYNSDGLFLSIPPYTFFENFNPDIKVLSKPRQAYSPMYEIGNPKIPVNGFFEIGIKPDAVPERLKNKTFIMSLQTGPIGGDYNDLGYLVGKARALGIYYIMADTIKPYIVPVNFKEGIDLSKKGAIVFRISDNLSGIRSYEGKIDGKWVLFQFDTKSASLYYLIDEYCQAGSHSLDLVVTDKTGNTRKVSYTFTN